MIPNDTPYDRDNCGIAAVAMLAKVSYAKAERLFLDLCDRKDITNTWDRMIVVESLGLTWTEDTHCRDKPTLMGWYKNDYEVEYDYLVTITGHVIVVRHWRVFDPVFREGIWLEDSPYKRKRVSSYLKLGEVP
jgi:hypothetical protein